MYRKIHKQIRVTLMTLILVMSSLSSLPAWAITYDYDELGRLTKVTYDDGSYVEYEYDDAGNRTLVTTTKI